MGAGTAAGRGARSDALGRTGKVLPPPDPVVQFLSRTSFGVRDSELQSARARGLQATIEAQLAPASIDETELERALAQRLPTLAYDVPQLVGYSQREGELFLPLSELLASTVARQLFSQRQLYEVMVEFWSNHFSVFHPDGPIRYFKSWEDRAVIRAHALGRFRDLLRGSARSPAMLYYLDNYTNVASGPNENYARELMELHTLGVDGGYGEADVREVARAFTGWSINTRAADGFIFLPLRHDTGEKRVLGTILPPGRGIEDGEDVLDLLAAHPSTARFIASKLVRRFVADDPPGALVERVAAEFTRTDGDIVSVLRVIFASDEFASSADRKFKRPAELVISTLRTSAASTGGDYIRLVVQQLTTLGQVPFQWSPPDGYPDTRDYWLNTSALLTRWNFALALAEGRLAPLLAIDGSALAGTARSPAQLVDRLADRLLHRALDPADRDALCAYAGGGIAADSAFRKGEREVAITALVGVLLASDYFQYH